MSGRRKRGQIEASRARLKEIKRQLRERKKTQGLESAATATLPNRVCGYENVSEERKARLEAVAEQVKILRGKLPILLRRLHKIPDPRNPRKIKHRLTCLMIYGILIFVLQVSSRREANRELTRPMFKENLRLLFPELEDIPHQDTLMRLLDRIEVDQIEAAQIELAQQLMRKKKFQRYLIDDCYPIAFDGTQKMVRQVAWSEECLERKVGTGEEKQKQYYVYVVEVDLVLENGMVVPLMSEFLEYNKGDTAEEKQDCEPRGFHRLAKRLKAAFPRTRFMVLLDGLYPNGPVIESSKKYNWQFMIVLQDGSLPQVWEEYRGLKKLLEPQERLKNIWGDRRQRFHWVNNIEYYYGANGRKRQIVHVVVCEESWQEVDPQTEQIVTKHARHVWLSSEPLDRTNVLRRCNQAARHRWGIESGILVEKRCGYQYEHCFSYSWNAMKGYHYLMRIGHLLNVLVLNAVQLANFVGTLGARGFIRFVRQTLSGPWLDAEQVQGRLSQTSYLRFV
jgi:hypothetical protein